MSFKGEVHGSCWCPLAKRIASRKQRLALKQQYMHYQLEPTLLYSLIQSAQKSYSHDWMKPLQTKSWQTLYTCLDPSAWARVRTPL